MTWAMIITLSVGNQFCGTTMRYQSLAACQAEIPAVASHINPAAQVRCDLVPWMFIGRAACVKKEALK